MKLLRKTITAVAFMLVQPGQTSAQYAPPPPPAPFQGFVNEWLRKDNPYMSQWDIGGNVRLRYELKDNFAISGAPGSLDFRDHGADVNNDYFLERIRYRIGYNEKWWSFLVEGRSSLAQSDERSAYTNFPPVAGTVARKGDGPESDTIDLHQAYVTLGNHKEFPLSLKVGRQELSYGEERMVRRGLFLLARGDSRRWPVQRGQRLRLVFRLLCQQHKNPLALARGLLP